MRIQRLCAVVLFSVTLCFTARADESAARPLRVEAYGDSITAGFLTGTNVASPPPLKEVSKIISDLALYLLTGQKEQVMQHHRADLAWPRVLGEFLTTDGSKVNVANYAVSGAHVSDLLGQVKNAGAVHSKTLAFFFIGHNDMCNNNASPEEIAEKLSQQYAAGLQEWDKNHVDSQAFLVPIGDINRVFLALQGYVWYQGPQGKYTCEDDWQKFFPYCRSYAALLKEGKLEEYLVPRLKATNAGIAKLAAAQADRTRKNRYVYLDGILEKPYEPKYFAVDCYHMSALGQHETAAQLFTAVLKYLRQ